jgi:hypothetical protein
MESRYSVYEEKICRMSMHVHAITITTPFLNRMPGTSQCGLDVAMNGTSAKKRYRRQRYDRARSEGRERVHLLRAL